MIQNPYIAVSGNIGSGKTTLVEQLSNQHDLQAFFETNQQNPYLSDFYQNMHQWAFHSQSFFLIQKFKIHQQIQGLNKVAILDRTLYEDAEIFAKRLYLSQKITARDYALYQDLYQTLRRSMHPPKLMIYLLPFKNLTRAHCLKRKA